MQLGMVGLGRMGAGLVRRLMKDGHACVVTDRDPGAIRQMESEGAIGAGNLAELVKALAAPRAVWVMVPAGAPTEAVIAELAGLLSSRATW
jgi:6-phosphogluconate dehydrogenase